MNKFLNYFTLHYFYVTIFKSKIFISKAFERSIKIMDLLKGYGKIYIFLTCFMGYTIITFLFSLKGAVNSAIFADNQKYYCIYLDCK